MIQTAHLCLLWFCAIGCAVIGGVYFTFSTFVMGALGTLERPSGIAAMQAVNEVILRSLFMPLFFGTTLASIVLAGLAVLQWQAPQSRLILLATTLFVIGMFVITIVCNVPLNNRLAAARAASPEAMAVWSTYLRNWTLWNHVRTLASIAASALFIAALARH